MSQPRSRRARFELPQQTRRDALRRDAAGFTQSCSNSQHRPHVRRWRRRRLDCAPFANDARGRTSRAARRRGCGGRDRCRPRARSPPAGRRNPRRSAPRGRRLIGFSRCAARGTEPRTSYSEQPLSPSHAIRPWLDHACVRRSRQAAVHPGFPALPYSRSTISSNSSASTLAGVAPLVAAAPVNGVAAGLARHVPLVVNAHAAVDDDCARALGVAPPQRGLVDQLDEQVAPADEVAAQGAAGQARKPSFCGISPSDPERNEGETVPVRQREGVERLLVQRGDETERFGPAAARREHVRRTCPRLRSRRPLEGGEAGTCRTRTWVRAPARSTAGRAEVIGDRVRGSGRLVQVVERRAERSIGAHSSFAQRMLSRRFDPGRHVTTHSARSVEPRSTRLSRARLARSTISSAPAEAPPIRRTPSHLATEAARDGMKDLVELPDRRCRGARAAR